MPFLASRVGIDSAGGGLLLPAGQLVSVRVLGVPWAQAPVQVGAHGSGPHAAATVSVGSTKVNIGGLPAVRQGLAATCGDLVTGSGHVSVVS